LLNTSKGVGCPTKQKKTKTQTKETWFWARPSGQIRKENTDFVTAKLSKIKIKSFL
jgi:hypothetical protein